MRGIIKSNYQCINSMNFIFYLNSCISFVSMSCFSLSFFSASQFLVIITASPWRLSDKTKYATNMSQVGNVFFMISKQGVFIDRGRNLQNWWGDRENQHWYYSGGGQTVCYILLQFLWILVYQAGEVIFCNSCFKIS